MDDSKLTTKPRTMTPKTEPRSQPRQPVRARTWVCDCRFDRIFRLAIQVTIDTSGEKVRAATDHMASTSSILLPSILHARRSSTSSTELEYARCIGHAPWLTVAQENVGELALVFLDRGYRAHKSLHHRLVACSFQPDIPRQAADGCRSAG